MKLIFKSELTRKRWKRFIRRKSAVFGCLVILLGIILTTLAPLITNSKPIFLHYDGKNYFPFYKTYLTSEFGITESLVVDYKKLDLQEDRGDFAYWPPLRWDPFESNEKVEYYPSPPNLTNLFGTDDRGRDVFARLLYGFKYSISYGLLVWGLSTFVGIFFGGIMGYFGGKVDLVGQRCVEILSTVPAFFLLLILVSIFKPSLTLLVIISSAFGWISISYYVRGEFLKNRKLDFVEAARSVGVAPIRLIFRHILPNSLGPVITYAPFVIAANIAGLASLDYLGFGLEVPTPSWGELLNQAQKNYTTAWWLAVFPSLFLFMTLFSFVLIGEGVRDAMDPKMGQ